MGSGSAFGIAGSSALRSRTPTDSSDLEEISSSSSLSVDPSNFIHQMLKNFSWKLCDTSKNFCHSRRLVLVTIEHIEYFLLNSDSHVYGYTPVNNPEAIVLNKVSLLSHRNLYRSSSLRCQSRCQTLPNRLCSCCSRRATSESRSHWLRSSTNCGTASST